LKSESCGQLASKRQRYLGLQASLSRCTSCPPPLRDPFTVVMATNVLSAMEIIGIPNDSVTQSEILRVRAAPGLR